MSQSRETKLPTEIKVEPKLRFTAADLDRVFAPEKFKPEALIALLEKQFPGIYDQDAGVWEGYSLKQHTLMVLQQFEKYYGGQSLPAKVDPNLFQLILALHDIGKIEAIRQGDKELQHQFTLREVENLFQQLNFDRNARALAAALIDGEEIGTYLRSRTKAAELNQKVKTMAQKAGLAVPEFFDLLCLFYKLDAGSYTENAGGLKSLDHLFEFDETKPEIRFSPDTQRLIDLLGYNR